jgi:hypothetical protein
MLTTDHASTRLRVATQFEYSVIAGCTDTQPQYHSGTWEGFRGAYLRKPLAGRQIKDGPAFLPAVLGDVPNENGSLRHNANVVRLTALVLDLDGKDRPYTSVRLMKALQGFEYFAYTTWRSTSESPRWRVIVPLASPILPAQLQAAFASFEKLTGLRTDVKARNASRLFYLPVERPGYKWCGSEWDDTARRLDPRSLGVCISSSSSESQERLNLVDLCKYENRSTKLNESRSTTPPTARPTKLSVPTASAPLHEIQNTEGEPLTIDDIISLYSSREIAVRVARLLELPEDAVTDVAAGNRASRSFSSPWRADNNPSCVLLMADGDELGIHDFGGGKTFPSLAAYAMTRAYKDKVPAKGAYGPLLVLYRVRLLVEAGILTTHPVEDLPPCPPDVTEAVRKVYEGFRLLVQCKNLVLKWADQPTVFAGTFIAAWCGVSYPTAHYARKTLTDLGLIGICGNVKGKRSPCVYAPGPHQKHPDAPKRKPSRSARLLAEAWQRFASRILARLGDDRTPDAIPAAELPAVRARMAASPDLRSAERFLFGTWVDNRLRESERRGKLAATGRKKKGKPRTTLENAP